MDVSPNQMSTETAVYLVSVFFLAFTGLTVWGIRFAVGRIVGSLDRGDSAREAINQNAARIEREALSARGDLERRMLALDADSERRLQADITRAERDLNDRISELVGDVRHIKGQLESGNRKFQAVEERVEKVAAIAAAAPKPEVPA